MIEQKNLRDHSLVRFEQLLERHCREGNNEALSIMILKNFLPNTVINFNRLCPRSCYSETVLNYGIEILSQSQYCSYSLAGGLLIGTV